MNLRFLRPLALGAAALLVASAQAQAPGDFIGTYPVPVGSGGIVSIGNGEVLIGNYDDNQLRIFDESGNFLRSIGTYGGGSPLGFQYTSDGNIAVTGASGDVTLYERSGVELFTADANLSFGWDIAEGPSGTLYAGSGNGGLRAIDGDTGALLPVSFGSPQAGGVAVDSEGNVYAAGSDGLRKFNASTGALVSYMPFGLGSIYDAKFGSNGLLYIVSSSQGVYQIDVEAMTPPVLFTDPANRGSGESLGFEFVGDELWMVNRQEALLRRFVGPEGSVEPPAVTGGLAYGTCPEALPAGRFTCFVEANGQNNLEVGQRYTVFLRVAETGRIAFRGETKPEALEDLTQNVRFRTVASDPFAFTLELVVEMGAVAAPSAEALVIGSLAFTKGAGLRAAEALTVYPNPTAGSATLRFAVAEQAEATLVVYDALGREVARPVDGAVSGVVEASFDGSALPAGLYVARLTTAAGTETVRLSVVR